MISTPCSLEHLDDRFGARERCDFDRLVHAGYLKLPADGPKTSPGDLCLDHVAHFVPDLDAAASDAGEARLRRRRRNRRTARSTGRPAPRTAA